MSSEKVLLIDGHSMAFRAFYALPVDNFSTSSGQHTNAVYGFTSMLINLMRDYDPTHIAVCFDVSDDTFRKSSYPEYKATRSRTPEEFHGQIDLIKELLDTLNIAHVEKAGFEADDLIATLSAQTAERGWKTFIISGDRDSFQLVDDDVTVLYPKRGVSELDAMDAEAIEAKYGVTPERYPEMAALVGETSDNLPGVPGVGEKTAAKWLAQFDGLDNLILRADQVTGKAGQSFRDHLADVKRNRHLNRLVRDVTLDVGPDDLVRREIDVDHMTQLFATLEFRQLRTRLLDTMAPAAEVETPTVEFTADVAHEGDVAAWLDEAPTLAIAMTWTDNTPADITGVALAHQDGRALWFDPADLSGDDDRAFTTWLADPNAGKIMHQAKDAMRAASHAGLTLRGVVFDTELAAYLLRPDQRSYDLADISMQYAGVDLGSAPTQAQPTLGVDDDSADTMQRAAVLFRLSEQLSTELKHVNQHELLTDVELPLQQILADMEHTGIAVSREYLEGLRNEFDSEVLKAQQGAWDEIGRQVNLASPKQLQEVLFDQLGLPKTKKIKTGYSTDAESLTTLYASTGEPFLAYLLAHRDWIKLRQSVDGLLKAIGDDGRIHTRFLQTIAATGRLSSADPNLQNIPIRTDEGRKVRAAFVAGAGFDALMSVDYSQIEMRVMAHGSGDEVLIEAFRSGADFHTITASRVFDVDVDDVTADQRSSVKQMNYGLAYGLSAFGLSSRLGVGVDEARSLMDDYFDTFGGVKEYLDDIVERARKTGYTETILGRRRYLPDLNSSNRRRREMAERMALNAPIQGSAADLIKVAMINVARRLEDEGLRSRLLLQIHDELVLEVIESERAQVEELVRDEMADAADLNVPLDVSVGYGDNWLTAAH